MKSWGVGVGEKVSGEKEGVGEQGVRETGEGGEGGECFCEALPRIIRDGLYTRHNTVTTEMVSAWTWAVIHFTDIPLWRVQPP